jgi:hypothetical protein
MSNNPKSKKRDTSQAKFKAFSGQVSPAWLPGVSDGNYQRALVDKSRMIRT